MLFTDSKSVRLTQLKVIFLSMWLVTAWLPRTVHAYTEKNCVLNDSAKEYLLSTSDSKSATHNAFDLTDSLLFYADFDNTVQPVYASGSSEVTIRNFVFLKGVRGGGLLSRGDTPLPEYSSIGNFPYLEGSISLWFRPEWKSGTGPSFGDGFLLSLRDLGRFYLVVKDGRISTVAAWPSATRMKYGKLCALEGFDGTQSRWYHIGLTWNDKKSHLYINGRKVCSSKGVPANIDFERHFGETFMVGGYLRGGRHVDGVIDELATWKRALSPKEMLNLYTLVSTEKDFLPPAFLAKYRLLRSNSLKPMISTYANAIPNGSFEAGIGQGGRVSVGQHDYRAFTWMNHSNSPVKIDDKNAKEGRRSLCFDLKEGERGRFSTLCYRLSPSNIHRYSAWIKAKPKENASKQSVKPVTVTLSNCPVDKKPWEARNSHKAAIAVDGRWHKIYFDAYPSKQPTNLYYFWLSVHHASIDPCSVWIDALSVKTISIGARNDEDYVPNKPVAWSLNSNKHARIYSHQDSVRLQMTAANESAENRTAGGVLTIYDYWGKETFSRKLTLQLSPNEIIEQEISIIIPNTGIFRAVLSLQDGTVADEMPFSILPTGRYDGFGAHIGPNDGALQAAERMGVTWIRDWDNSKATSWVNLQPEENGPYRWMYSDECISAYREHGFNVLGVLSVPEKWERHIQTSHKSWMYHKYGNASKNLLHNPEYRSKWLQYVEKVVEHFNEKINAWEILNEPYQHWSWADYLKIVDMVIPIIRKHNPTAKIIGPCAYWGVRKYEKWYKNIVYNGALSKFSAFSYHGYDLKVRELHDLLKPVLSVSNIEAIFDTENSGNCESRFFCRSWLGKNYSGRNTYQTATRNIVKSIVTEKNAGANVYFHYMTPSRYFYEAYDNYATFLEHDGSLTSPAVACSLTMRRLDNFQPAGRLLLEDYFVVMLFENGHEQMAVCWDDRGRNKFLQLKLSTNVDGLFIYDVMGNALDYGGNVNINQITIGSDPVFIRCNSMNLLDTIKNSSLSFN